MEEFGRGLLGGLGQRDPALDAEHTAVGFRFPFLRAALRMDDALAGRHPIHIAWRDDLRRAEAVAVHDFALEQVCHRGEPDMRMRPDADAFTKRELRGPHLVPEYERPHHLPPGGGERAADAEAAQIANPGHNHDLNRVAGPAVAGNRVFCGLPAHCRSLHPCACRRVYKA